MQEQDLTTKRSILERLLDLDVVQVTLDARVAGVQVPAHLIGNPQLRLNISYRYGLPLELDDWGVHATLTFRGARHACCWPWNAVYALVPHTANPPHVFPNDIPVDLLTEQMPDEPPPTPEKSTASLRLVESPRESDAAPDVAEPSPPTTPPDKKKRHLRVVK